MSFEELEKQGLLITTTKWWGSHPSMVYYFGKKVNPLYSESEFNNTLLTKNKNDCFVVEEFDRNLITYKQGLKTLKTFDNLILYK